MYVHCTVKYRLSEYQLTGGQLSERSHFRKIIVLINIICVIHLFNLDS